MAFRKITVISTSKSQPTTFESEATTYGQLKDSLREFGDLGKLRVVVKETKSTLELDDAVLPQTDFTLFLTAKQIKAGAVDIAAVLSTLRNNMVAKIEEAFDETLEAVEDGNFGEEDEEDEDQDEEYGCGESIPKASSNKISQEDLNILKEMENLKF